MAEAGMPGGQADPTHHRRIWRLSWPILLANLTIPMVGLADTAVMGQLGAPAFIGAVALGGTLFSAIYWGLGFLRMSTTALAAQALGGNDIRELAGVYWRASFVALALGGGVVAAQAAIWPLAAVAFQADAPVLALAQEYFQIRIWGVPAMLLYLVQLGMLFGTQHARATLFLSIALNLSNLLLDLYFVLVLELGVAGVATGTLLSEWGAALVGMLLVRQVLGRVGWSAGRPDGIWAPARVRALFQVSRDLIIRAFFVQFPFFATTAVGARLGDVTLAANAILMQFYLLTVYAMDAFAYTAETLTGYALGARNRQLFRRASLRTALWGAGTALLASALLWACGDWAIVHMSESPAVQAAALHYLPWIALGPLLSVWAFQLDGIFIGTTQTGTLRNAMFLAWLLYCVTLWLTLEPWGNHGLWFALLVFMVARALLLVRHYPRLEALLPAN